jgi:hypothetical protein
MSMKIAVGILALLFATSVFAQSPPKIGNKTLVQVRPKEPMGCKLVGTVKGTKIWAGDCVDATEQRGAAPVAQASPQSLPEAAAGAIPRGQKQ